MCNKELWIVICFPQETGSGSDLRAPTQELHAQQTQYQRDPARKGRKAIENLRAQKWCHYRESSKNNFKLLKKMFALY